MANLKADLDNYLKGGGGGGAGKRASGLSLSGLANSFSLPTLKSPFSAGAGGSSGGTSPGDDQERLMEEGIQNQSGSGWFVVEGGDSGCLPSMTKKQRIIGFMVCLFMGVLCFGMASMYFPVLVMFSRKFALLFSLGSFSMLWGPWNHLKHLFGKERLPFTTVYLGTLFGTLYFALGLQSTVLTIVAASGQVLALGWFVISYIPGGQTGLKFFSKICSAFCKTTVGRSLPV